MRFSTKVVASDAFFFLHRGLTSSITGDELSESFFLIPSGAEPSAATLKKENLALKAETDTLRRRLEAAEKVLQVRKEQDAQLRDSVYQATKEIVSVILSSLWFHYT